MVTRAQVKYGVGDERITTIQVMRGTRKAIMKIKPSDETYDEFFTRVFKL